MRIRKAKLCTARKLTSRARAAHPSRPAYIKKKPIATIVSNRKSFRGKTVSISHFKRSGSRRNIKLLKTVSRTLRRCFLRSGRNLRANQINSFLSIGLNRVLPSCACAHVLRSVVRAYRPLTWGISPKKIWFSAGLRCGVSSHASLVVCDSKFRRIEKKKLSELTPEIRLIPVSQVSRNFFDRQTCGP